MNLTGFICFWLFLALVASISFLKARKIRLNTTAAYFMGNRTLGFWMVGFSLFLTNLSCNQFVGENEFVYVNDMTVMAWGMSSILAMLVVAEFFLPIYLKMGAVTTPDYLGHRFGPRLKKLVSLIFLISYLVTLIPTILYGSAVALNGIFHIDEALGIPYFPAIWLLVVMVGVIGCCYTVIGGFKAITVSDLVQGAGLLAGGIALIWYSLRYLGGGDAVHGIQTILGSKKEHLNAIGSAQDPIPFSTLFTGMFLINLYYWGMEQYIMQQALAAKSLSQGQKGMSLAAVGKLISPLLLNVPGLIAVHLYPNITNTATVFPRLVGDVLPPVMTGFIAAIIFGAAISTFNAGLNSSGTLFIMNLYKPWRKEAKDRELVKAARIFQISICAVAMCFSPFIFYFDGGFYHYIQKISSFFSVPVFTVMIVGFLTKRVSEKAALIGLVFFIVTYTLSQFAIEVPMHYLHVVAILFVVTIVLILGISRWMPRHEPYSTPHLAVVDLKPWRHRHYFFFLLIVLMAGAFLLFSKAGIAD
ncbi:solute:sodium symporter family transporter [Paraflavitalea sp. CAU 1676]|uniref:solute:sodium symporter family transporter n=1 Tax=Paraflavitalea sp. CAU 1676 TaxID=3032598 RepID=UPI0023DB2600|nr:solute:sodium symporter family transporter [Paraflavitalea sp. CAU 1676]MDF2188271.1 solute:sodium symporter family transporter [Paraflavitalea sp. CAU 1676]